MSQVRALHRAPSLQNPPFGGFCVWLIYPHIIRANPRESRVLHCASSCAACFTRFAGFLVRHNLKDCRETDDNKDDIGDSFTEKRVTRSPVPIPTRPQLRPPTTRRINATICSPFFITQHESTNRSSNDANKTFLFGTFSCNSFLHSCH